MKVINGELVDGQGLPPAKHCDDLTPEAQKIRDAHEANVRNGRKGGLQTALRKAPANCRHCQMMGYTSWMQHIGHKGFAAMLRKNPSAAHIVRAKIRNHKLPPLPEPGEGIPF